MSIIPNRFVTRFDRLRHPAPALVQVVDAPRIVTLRTWAKSPLKESARSDIDVNVHAASQPGTTFAGEVVDGVVFAEKLSGQSFRELGSVALDIDTVQSLHEWSDMARWMFPIGISGAPETPYNARTLTVNTKATGSRHLMVSQHGCALVVFVYFRQLDFTEASYLLIGHPTHGAVGDLAARATIIKPEAQIEHTLRGEPRITISGPDTLAVGGEVELICRVHSSGGKRIAAVDTEFFVEATGGYLPLHRVSAPAGEGRFRVLALGNQLGDQFKIKVGYRHVSGLAEHTLTVV